MKFLKILSAVTVLTATATLAQAQVNYDESVSPDLSALSGAPSVLGPLGLGLNSVTGEINEGSTAGAGGSDVFSFTVPSGQELASVEFTQLGGDNHFFGFSNVNAAIDATSAAGNRYSTLLGSPEIGTNILDGGLNSFGGSGGSGNLGAGDYTVYFRENAAGTFSYSLALTTVAAVPEPGSLSLLIAGTALVGLRRRR